jgi:hypothetical protein
VVNIGPFREASVKCMSLLDGRVTKSRLLVTMYGHADGLSIILSILIDFCIGLS